MICSGIATTTQSATTTAEAHGRSDRQAAISRAKPCQSPTAKARHMPDTCPTCARIVIRIACGYTVPLPIVRRSIYHQPRYAATHPCGTAPNQHKIRQLHSLLREDMERDMGCDKTRRVRFPLGHDTDPTEMQASPLPTTASVKIATPEL
jgi:hypothetical protein